MTAYPLPTSRRRKKLVVVALFALFVGTGCIVAGLLYVEALARDGTRISFANPSGGASSSSIPLIVQPDRDVAAQGMVCKLVSVSEEVEQIVFIRKEKRTAHIEIKALERAVDLSGLSYVLYDEDGREVGRGALSMSGRLMQGESQNAEIADHRISDARRLVIRRRV